MDQTPQILIHSIVINNFMDRQRYRNNKQVKFIS